MTNPISPGTHPHSGVTPDLQQLRLPRETERLFPSIRSCSSINSRSTALLLQPVCRCSSETRSFASPTLWACAHCGTELIALESRSNKGGQKLTAVRPSAPPLQSRPKLPTRRRFTPAWSHQTARNAPRLPSSSAVVTRLHNSDEWARVAIATTPPTNC